LYFFGTTILFVRINRATENDKFLNPDHYQVIGLHIAAGELGIALVKQLARRKYFGAAPDPTSVPCGRFKDHRGVQRILHQFCDGIWRVDIGEHNVLFIYVILQHIVAKFSVICFTKGF
jgi:hypothetical protein